MCLKVCTTDTCLCLPLHPHRTLPLPRIGGVFIRMLESPSAKALEAKVASIRAQGGASVLAKMPAFDPVAQRSNWAYGDGGHLLPLLENSIVSQSGVDH